MKKRLLVFPCGSEIGLEIHRALRYSTHFDLIGASSVDDHGRFVYENYVGGLPFHDHPDFAARLTEIVQAQRIDALYPTMDAVADTVQHLAAHLGIRAIGSGPETTRLCASKRLTYAALDGLIPIPSRYPDIAGIPAYPVFIKPDRGYGSRHAARADDADDAVALLARRPGQDMLILEYLPGREWTVDCFSDRHGALLFHAARGRDRISNGISVRTSPDAAFADLFANWATIINRTLRPRGAWFFQAKLGQDGCPKLLEVAARFAGSSALQRGLGVNLPLLSAFDAFDWPVSILANPYPIVLDRALENRFRIQLDYRHVYVDLDDCLLIQGRVNVTLLAFLYQAINNGCTVTLLTRHAGDLNNTLIKMRLDSLFDNVMHIKDGSSKAHHIHPAAAIFIDDSFQERADVRHRLGIPVFSPDMIEALL
ncbi:ATP-grasp domain-containing protein [Castellaniella hirudinis]|uniref:ATP-grasp domain-containing protein n=1 Tax=Castellaniella hirudinis TaxID=1144617 RepID=UPI0039C3070D